MPFVWIFYDISKDAARTRTAKMCKKAGLRRIQKSIFLGNITDRNIALLTQAIQQKINPISDRLLVLPDDKTALKRIKAYGQLTTKSIAEFWTRRVSFV